jgi:3-hydroxyisobutyrate dehydrogenase-like beta-hydroxyacid dehydrogenase
MPQSVVGLIGTGLLGSALAHRLIAAGYEVVGFDPDPDAQHKLQAAGGRCAASLTELVSVAEDRILLCLPDSNVVEDVVTQLKPLLAPNTVLIDTTTGEPQRTQQLHQQLAADGIALVEACVLGSSEVTRTGNAVLLVSGQATVIQQVSPLLQSISETIHNVGGPGDAQRMKLVANLVLGLNRAVLAEGLHFAQSLHLDPAAALQVLQSGAAYSKVMDAKGQKMIDRNFEPQARLRQHLKDVDLMLAEANAASITLPLSTLHRTLLQTAQNHGHSNSDNSAIITAWD